MLNDVDYEEIDGLVSDPLKKISRIWSQRHTAHLKSSQQGSSITPPTALRGPVFFKEIIPLHAPAALPILNKRGTSDIRTSAVSLLVYLTPIWLVLEVLQLVVCERYLGVRQIESGTDPRTRGPSEPAAFLWMATILAYWLWLVGMLLQPFGRLQVVAIIAISLGGHALRRICGLKWVLVVLTFEGAIRIGMLLSIVGLAWRQL